MDIHVDIRGFLEIYAWVCYGFSDQGIESVARNKASNLVFGNLTWTLSTPSYCISIHKIY